MKGFILPLIAVVAIAIPTMLGFVPAFIGVPAMLVVVLVKDIIFMVLARGLPMAIVSVRATGGMLWGVMQKAGNIAVGKKQSMGGLVSTKDHGAYNAVTEGMVKLDGVPFCLAPEEIGYNAKLDHLQLLAELKDRGIKNILEIIDVNAQGQFKNFKDDPRIRDLKDKFTTLPKLIDLPGLNDFHRYAIESAHPFRQDANVKIGIAQGVGRGAKGVNTGLWVIIGVIIGVVITLGVSFLMGGNGGEQVVRVVTENGGSGTTVIPI